eukprot:548907-Pyramimonas_sp.AAC.1
MIIATHKAAEPLKFASPYALLIIGEAGQAHELTAAMSLVNVIRSGEHLLLIGDPKQLPPTVLSRKAADRGLCLSMFDRLHNALGEDTPAV